MVGECGSGKTTLLKLQLDEVKSTLGLRAPTACATAVSRDLYRTGEARAPLPDAHRLGLCPSETLPMACASTVSAGANVGERLMGGRLDRHYGKYPRHRSRLAGARRDRRRPY